MKKLLLLLSLSFTTQGVFSSNSVNYNNQVQNSFTELCKVNIIQGAFSVNLGNNYVLAGIVSKTSNFNYSFVATLSHSGTFVGTVSGSFQSQLVNGVEVVIDSSWTETYSSDQTSSIVKPRHDTVKGVVQNIR